SSSTAQLGILSQGSQATADQRAPDASGSVWYHVKQASLAGWVRSDLVVTTAIHAASGLGWSLMLPPGYQVAPSSDPSLTTIAKTGDDLPFLVLQTSTSDTLTIQLPAQLRADTAPVADHTTAVQVWSYTARGGEQVSRVALDTCKVTSAWARPRSGLALHVGGLPRPRPDQGTQLSVLVLCRRPEFAGRQAGPGQRRPKLSG